MLYANAKIDPDLLVMYKNFLNAMDNDFNTANAITALQDLNKKSNQLLRSKTELEILLSCVKIYDDIFEVLGLKTKLTPLNIEDKDTYKKWVKARTEKDFDSADKYRIILQEKGII